MTVGRGGNYKQPDPEWGTDKQGFGPGGQPERSYTMKRYAIVRNARTRREAEAYLPDNYRVIHEQKIEGREDLDLFADTFVIEGKDNAGWTLDGYVIPRYASGLIGCEEIGLDHPIMKRVPA